MTTLGTDVTTEVANDTSTDIPSLRFHGDVEAAGGLLDLAVNARAGTPPRWLVERLAALVAGLAAYPDLTAATAAIARRHGRDESEVLLTAGAAEAFALLARALTPRHALVVHPQFTEPESALRAAGHPVERAVLDRQAGFRLDWAALPEAADLVMVGNPTNPTGVLHPAAGLARLARTGRVLVVDEAFMDFVPGEPESLASRRLPGLVVVRSFTKMWGLAGLRVGYVVGDASVVARMRDAQALWPVSALAAEAAVACCEPRALEEAARAAKDTAAARADLLARLSDVPGLCLPGEASANFVLVRGPVAGLREELRSAGIAVRRGETFPGLGPQWFRVAVRDAAIHRRLAEALRSLLG